MLFIAFTFWFCSPKVLPPTTAQLQNVKSQYPDMDTVAINKGYILFSENCNKCHRLKNPGNYSDEEWHKILPVMSKKAKLNPEETDLIQTYVLAFSEDRTNKVKPDSEK